MRSFMVIWQRSSSVADVARSSACGDGLGAAGCDRSCAAESSLVSCDGCPESAGGCYILSFCRKTTRPMMTIPMTMTGKMMSMMSSSTSAGYEYLACGCLYIMRVKSARRTQSHTALPVSSSAGINVLKPWVVSNLTACWSNETNTSPPRCRPSCAMMPSAKSPPAASRASPRSTATRFITTLRLLASVWIAVVMAVLSRQ